MSAAATMLPHPAGAQAKLTIPHGEQLPVRTYEQGEEVVLLVLTDIDESLVDEQLEPSLLEYTSPRGVVRIRGEAIFERRSRVRFHRHGDAEVIQRRAFVRVHTPQQVLLGESAPDDALRPAHTVDLSGGGMLVSGAESFQIGDRVRFRIRLGEQTATIGGVARVVRIGEDGKRALMFEQIGEKDRQRLIRFVFGVLRTAAARTRGDLV